MSYRPPNRASAVSLSADCDERGGLLPAVLLLVGFLLCLAGLSFWADRAEGQYLLVGNPFGTSQALLSLLHGTDAAVIGAGGVDNLLIISSDDPKTPELLRVAGAWAVLPVPRVLGCAPLSSDAELKA